MRGLEREGGADRWIARGRRLPVVAVGLVPAPLLQLLLALPMVPENRIIRSAGV
ncbi:hypothetical protein ACWC9T_11520 [Kitasatospora sp. NPDC001159]